MINFYKSILRQPAEMRPLVDSIKQIEQAFKRIWDSSRPLPEDYTNRHPSLAGLLQDNENLLGNADQFPEESVGWDKSQLMYEIDTNGLLSMHTLHKQTVKDWFLMVELAKTLAFFKQLHLDDQVFTN
jgi:hypothetical protein